MRRAGYQPERLRLLGGLPLVATFFGAVLLLGCEEEAGPAKSVVRERSAAVVAKPEAKAEPGAAKPQGSTGTAPAKAGTQDKKPPRKLCDSKPKAYGKAWPNEPVSTQAADGALKLPSEIPVGGGQWTWINLWAAWCVPCKKEIPILRQWEQELNQPGQPGLRLVFVSLDDDERQLSGFMKGQPDDGIRASYWLEDGKQRESWFEAIELESDIQLPAHILLNGKGEVSCIVKGAIEAADLPQVKKLTQG